jgi:Matrixin/IPT/TIG domain
MSKGWTSRVAVLAAAFVFASSGSAYYHYVSFNSRSAPFNPIVAKFDLNALNNNTVPFFISNQGATVMYPGDSLQAMVSQIRAAADVWNSVGTSQIRLAYGGLASSGASKLAPGIDVEFSDDIAPGILALGGPESMDGQVAGPNGPFVPIRRSLLRLRRDMGAELNVYGAQAASFSEMFFVTVVHEFGHTLGLQHTLTSSVMSTLVTSTATKSQPLGMDDIAGISLLYPTTDYLASVGSISGRVTLNGTGVNLASLVAISASSPAISTLTNPDGTYQIDGVPPGQYFIYAHPLPPALQGEDSPANIVYPKDAGGRGIPPNYTAFATQFYPGTRDPQQAQSIFVSAGNVTAIGTFRVNSLPFDRIPVHSVRVYGFSQANVSLTSAPVELGSSTPVPVVAAGVGLLQSNNNVTAGLNVATLGTVAQVTDLRLAYAGLTYVAVNLRLSLGPGPGPKHLLFSTKDDLYVLPSGFSVVANAPPSITSVGWTTDTNGNRGLTIGGTNLQTDTRIFFDGMAASIQQVNGDGSFLVQPPQAPGGYTANVVALNSDGQSSLFLQTNPQTFTYDAADLPSLTVSPTFLAPGGDVTVDVVGNATNFVDGQTLVGFETSDVTIKKVTVLSPTHLTVLVTPNTTVPTSIINITTGLRLISQALGNQITVTAPQSSNRK